MKILYISKEDLSSASGGIAVDRRNLRTISKIFGETNVSTYFLPSVSIKTALKSLLTLSSYNLDREIEKNIINLYKTINFDFVFIEGSYYGFLVKRLKRAGARVIIHLHNVETSLYRQRLSSCKSLVSLFSYIYISLNEKISIRNAAYVIAMNGRDNSDLEDKYKRKADAIIPITFPSRLPVEKLKDSSNPDRYILFVGSNFFPNVEGLLWYINNVASEVSINLKVVGSVCKNPIFQNISIPDNVELCGYIDNIDKYYIDASAVIAPIFKGSGMKTKTIEALSYGKTIIGSEEAFVGLDKSNIPGKLCYSAYDFIDSINSLSDNTFSEKSYEIFRSGFSDDVFEKKLTSFFTKIDSI